MLNLKHGGHILDDNAPGAEKTTRKMDDVILMRHALRKDEPRPTETPFDYLDAVRKNTGHRNSATFCD